MFNSEITLDGNINSFDRDLQKSTEVLPVKRRTKQKQFLSAEGQKLQLTQLPYALLYFLSEASFLNPNSHTGAFTENAYEHKWNIHHSPWERRHSHLQRFIKFRIGAVTLNFGLAFTLAGLIRQEVSFDISVDQAVSY